MRGSRANAGFTLIEMTVTVGILSILAAMTVPTMKTWILNAKVRAVADALQNGVRLAQAESLRRSRQVAFALTNSTTPESGFTASGSGNSWAIEVIPAMIDGTETPTFVESGVLGALSANVQVSGPAEICFNSAGRLITNSNPGVGGAACTVPTPATAGAPPKAQYQITLTGADRPLEVDVALGGQVHLCYPTQTLSSTNPYGC